LNAISGHHNDIYFRFKTHVQIFDDVSGLREFALSLSLLPFFPIVTTNVPRSKQVMFWTHRSFWILPILIAAILGGFTVIVSQSRLRNVYKRKFPESRRERLFLASVGFFTTALVVRAITIAIHYDIGPFHDVSMRGRHIHHLVWGILLLLLVGYLWLIELGTGAAAASQWSGRLTSILFGVAAALTLDEFALWLNLRDVYWEREGRESFEALALFGGFLAIGIFGWKFWHGVATELASIFRGSTAQHPR
jgi:hypothetical protein